MAAGDRRISLAGEVLVDRLDAQLLEVQEQGQVVGFGVALTMVGRLHRRNERSTTTYLLYSEDVARLISELGRVWEGGPLVCLGGLWVRVEEGLAVLRRLVAIPQIGVEPLMPTIAGKTHEFYVASASALDRPRVRVSLRVCQVWRVG
jgi:hypothetical protein